MIKISPVPVGYPAKEANGIKVRIMPFQTNAVSCNTYYELVKSIITIDEEGVPSEAIEVLADGNQPITEEQFALWSDDNAYIEDIVLSNLGLTRE